jgi:hypothetical protein
MEIDQGQNRQEKKKIRFDRKWTSRPEDGKKYLGPSLPAHFRKQRLDRGLECAINAKQVVDPQYASCCAALQRFCSLRRKPLSFAF